MLITPGMPQWNRDADFNGDRRVNFVAVVKARFCADYWADNPSGIPNACSD